MSVKIMEEVVHLMQDLQSKQFQASRTRETPYIVLLDIVKLHFPEYVEDENGIRVTKCGECKIDWLWPCFTVSLIQEALR